MSDVRFLAIADGTSDGYTQNSEEKVKRYLYSGSYLLSSVQAWNDARYPAGAYEVRHLALVADARGEAASERNATTQAERLRSGGIQVQVFETFSDAVRYDWRS